MQLRKKNNATLLAVFLFCFASAWLAAAEPSYAQANPVTVIGTNGEICPYFSGFTSRIVNCINGTLVWAVQRYLVSFNSYFITTVNVLAVLATLLYGFFVLTGRAQPAAREAFALVIKIGVVIWMINLGAFGIIFPALIGTIDWLVELVSQYTAIRFNSSCPASVYIWDRVDCALAFLIGGILPGTTVASGMVGLLGSLLFSTGVGIGLFFFGLAIIVSVLMALGQAMFILLSAYIALALLALVAPLTIPMILFRVTKGYFEKWLRMLVGVMLQPLFLFAYLTMFLIALEMSLFSGPYSVYRAIACNHVEQPGFMIGNYLIGSGAYAVRSGESALVSTSISQNSLAFAGNAIHAQVQDGGVVGKEAVIAGNASTLYNGAGISVDVQSTALDLRQLAANCGYATDNNGVLTYFIRILLSMFTAMAVIYIFYTMLQFIPYLGTLLSSDLFGLPNLMNLLPTSGISGNQMAKKLGFGGGGP